MRRTAAVAIVALVGLASLGMATRQARARAVLPAGPVPAGFAARYAGAGRVAFTWQPVAGAAGVAVYDARTGDQVSPLVQDTAWTSGALPSGSYTFVGAPWRSVAQGTAPALTADRSAPAVVTIPRY